MTRSTSAWKASYWGGEDSDDDRDDLAGDHEGTAHTHPRRSKWCTYSTDAEWSDEENEEILSELGSDDGYDCPYELLTLEEALRQRDECRKAGLAAGNHVNLAAHEKGYKLMSIQETLMWKNEAAEPSLVINVSSGETSVQRLWVEYDMEMNVQMNHINWPERGLIESAVVRLKHEAAYTDSERMSAERMTLSTGRCSFSLEARRELPQTETWEVESGKYPTQEVECVFKYTEEQADLKLDCVRQDNQKCMYVQKEEAESLSHVIQSSVEYELKLDLKHYAHEVEEATTWKRFKVGMIEELLKEPEELDKPHEWSDDDEATID